MTPSTLTGLARQALRTPAVLLGGTAFVGIAAVAVALVTQHVFGMQPCPWCILQRVIFLAISAVCVIALVWRRPAARLIAAGLGVLLALAGIACALWQHFHAAASDSCALTLADSIVSGLGLDTLIPAAFMAGAGCADAATDLLGVPYPFWSLALFVIMGAGCVLVIGQTRGGSSAIALDAAAHPRGER